jgi:uncharacterized protein YdeI (YjbR/CyaY-like superfamily)
VTLPPDTLELASRAELHRWLAANHAVASVLWVVFYKKHTGREWLAYEDAVEEALCWGWIDSLAQRLDDDRYRQKLTPRRPGSRWSAINKRRIATLAARGLLQPAGRAVVDAARRDGSWDRAPDAERSFALPPELAALLDADPALRAAFDRLAPSRRRQYVLWVASAKRTETRARRAAQARPTILAGHPLGSK